MLLILDCRSQKSSGVRNNPSNWWIEPEFLENLKSWGRNATKCYVLSGEISEFKRKGQEKQLKGDKSF